MEMVTILDGGIRAQITRNGGGHFVHVKRDPNLKDTYQWHTSTENCTNRYGVVRCYGSFGTDCLEWMSKQPRLRAEREQIFALICCLNTKGARC